jgi:hypothetical protein
MASQKGKASKRSEDTSSKIGRFYKSLRGIHPTTALIAAIVVVFAIFMFSGGLYVLINHPATAVYYNSKFYLLYPDLNYQFVSDTFIAGILYALGFLGLLSIYQSSRSAYNPRQAYMMLLIGIALVLVSYVALEGSIAYKISGGT